MTLLRSLLLGATLALVPALAAGQGVEAVGMRALGMGGAFVAVADDASATYWNPAGLVTGSVVSAVAEVTRADVEGVPLALGAPGTIGSGFSGRDSTLVALGTWPVGMTFYRLSGATARVVGGGTDTVTALRRLTTTHVGVNLLHSIVSGLHVGATLKYVHGSAGQELRLTPDDPLDAARDLDTRGSSRFDADAGVMLALRRMKLGLTGRNLFEPEFDSTDQFQRLQLPRQVRAGMAFLATESLIVSVDADLTRTPDVVSGDWRSLAAGAEQRLWQDRAAVRGGFRISTTGHTRPIVTTGGSIALKSGIFADGYVAVGLDEASPDGFGVGVRLVF